MSPRRKLLAAIAIGVALAGPPVAAFNIWLSGLVERQGRQELELAARRHMALSEARVDRVLAALDDVAKRGIDSCKPADIEALRRANFTTAAVKEFSIVDPDGKTLCSDVGNQSDQRQVVSSEPLAAGSSYLMEVIKFGTDAGISGPWVRFRKANVGAAYSVAALVPALLFVPQVSNSGEPMNFHARMLTSGGALIAESGHMGDANTNAGDLLVVDLSSSRYPLRTHITAPPGNVGSGQGDLRTIGAVASGLLAIFILALSMLLPRRERANPIADIERALGAGEFVPYFQPIVDIRSGRLRGAEVLVRWRKPDGSIVPPASFIPLAESSGLIIELTRSLMRRTLQEAGQALGKRPHVTLGFNLTAQHFASEEIVDDVRTIFKRSPLKMSQLVLEVTERQPIENLTETRRVIAALQGLGCKVAIDDVGSGHSGLSYMLKLGADIIKIDKLFIDSIGIDRNSNTIIETLVDLAQNMRMDVVAEGVESFEQVVHLRELGIRAAQGYVFAPPLPGPVFLKLVDAIDPLKKRETEPLKEDVAAVAAAV
ncbi:EAL domain-containing protein [Rhodoplanes sp. Z2-YC6860]|uniref:EAL domain-containing protein n=1 Tax=Rhodoplanes sp. Z2-YC6860 TaxID=674703 RepID=UPI00078EDCB1|nr:EAL domain-containing protein [Rhodoplanes sp. Z2-YC6860]AMN42857.1 Cyclic diguanylate phosphodiesterase domain-containing protein [Rhodoplanes sp. Z2-YC6860]